MRGSTITMTKHKPHRSVVITAIVVIGALEAYALSQGIDGVLLTGVLALLAGLAGWVIPSPQLKTH